VTEQTTELNFPSRVESIAEATEVAVELARRAGFSDESLYGIDMAVREAFTNAVLHGSGGDESKLAGLEVQVLGDALHIAVRDRGEGFDPATIPDPTDPQNLLKASGRGILFMRTSWTT
jgi:serine/threonine-protein kinase RsbW